MSIKVTLEGARELSPGVWEATISPEDMGVLGQPTIRGGAISVVYLPNMVPHPSEGEQLSFEPSHARVLCAGTTPKSVLVFGRELRLEGDDREILRHKFGPGVQHDDDAFLQEAQLLPRTLAQAGKDLLDHMRSEFQGYFQRTTSGRYVNRPNNFWTVKVQPQDVSLRFTVRGNPQRFTSVSGIRVQPDRNGYSTFKVSSATNMPAALQILRIAAT